MRVVALFFILVYLASCGVVTKSFHSKQLDSTSQTSKLVDNSHKTDSSHTDYQSKTNTNTTTYPPFFAGTPLGNYYDSVNRVRAKFNMAQIMPGSTVTTKDKVVNIVRIQVVKVFVNRVLEKTRTITHTITITKTRNSDNSLVKNIGRGNLLLIILALIVVPAGIYVLCTKKVRI